MPLALPDALARQIVTGRQLAEQRRRTPGEEVLGTGCEVLDCLLDGGLCRGTMVELVGGRSSGRFSLVMSVLAAVTGCGEAAALVDLGDAFDPQGAAAAAVDLDRLLWARPRTTKEALASAEAILASGIPLVVIELGMPPVPGGRGLEAGWLRLARRARTQRVALLVASPYRVSGTAAQEVVETRIARPSWMGSGLGPRLLTGLETHLELRKSRPRAARTGAMGEAVALRCADCIEGANLTGIGDARTSPATVPAPSTAFTAGPRAERRPRRRAIA